MQKNAVKLASLLLKFVNEQREAFIETGSVGEA